jgi:pimeloyl-ACP methyl ester carboxylesterase
VLAELAMAPRRRLAALEARPGDTQIELRVGRRRLRVHSFGEGPLVVLVHGWQGAASQLRGLAEAVVAGGFRVALFDMPAHGEAPGWSTSGAEFIHLLTHVARELGPLHALIGHSLGGSVALKCAAQGLPMAGVVALAPIPSFEFVLRAHARAFGLAPKVREWLAQHFEARTRMKRSELDLASLELGVPALLVHDLLDRVVPSRHSRRLKLSWSSASLIETCGFGHRRVLTADLVAQEVVAFLASLPVATRGPAPIGAQTAAPLPRTESRETGSARSAPDPERITR